jgi:uncharacterized protein YdhG (YjbR/CyaY superfamily)
MTTYCAGSQAIIPDGMRRTADAYQSSPAVSVADGRLIFVSGQVGGDEAGQPIADPEAQFVAAIENLREILEAAGGTLADVVEITTYGGRAVRSRGTSALGAVAESSSCATGETVSAEEVDAYLRALEEPKRSTLEALRRVILEIVPDAEEVISYRVPAFRVDSLTVAGFAAFRNHLSYLPFSGSVLPQLADELEGYTMTKSALHFPVDRPLQKRLVKRLIAVRLADAGRASC